MIDVLVEKLNEVYVRLVCEPYVAQEIGDYFTFKVPGYFFAPSYKAGLWDGKIRLVGAHGELYFGLFAQVKEFCAQHGYTVKAAFDDAADNVSLHEVKEWVATLSLPFEIAEHQIEPLVWGLRNRRMLLVSPTGSGKSLLAYLFAAWHENADRRTLIIEPTTTLVHQIAGDFKDYNSLIPVHKIHEGQSLDSKEPIVISTWQSIYKQPASWYEQFDVIIGDEAHNYKSVSLRAIMENARHVKYRFGMTGTLDGTPTHKLVLEGLFGQVRQFTTTAELIERKFLAELTIKTIVLSYPDAMRRLFFNAPYRKEIDFLCGYGPRNKFIRNLALSLEGNVLLLFNFVDKHGQLLYNMIANNDRPVYYVHGKVEGEERDEIRKIIEQETNAILIASYGTFSTGINIKNLHNVIPASPFKSRIRNLQSLGRGLRVSETKTAMTWLDIADDLSWNENNDLVLNTTLKHYTERLAIYKSEGFKYKQYKVKL